MGTLSRHLQMPLASAEKQMWDLTNKCGEERRALLKILRYPKTSTKHNCTSKESAINTFTLLCSKNECTCNNIDARMSRVYSINTNN